jgi:hypothetical protein
MQSQHNTQHDDEDDVPDLSMLIHSELIGSDSSGALDDEGASIQLSSGSIHFHGQL